MKKILLILAPIALIILYSSASILLLTPISSGEYSLYTDELQEEYSLDYKECLKKIFFTDEKGVSVRLEENADYKRITTILSATHNKTEKIEGAVLLYYYSPYLKNYVNVDGKRTNLEIYVSNDCVIVGTPLIMGSI